MKISRYFLPLLLISLLLSCNKTMETDHNELIVESSNYYMGYEIESVVSYAQTKEEIKKFNTKSNGFEIDFNNSVKVNYKDLPFDVIITPLVSETKNNQERYHLYYIEDSVISDISMNFSKTIIDESTALYEFFTPENDLLYSFNVNPEGVLSNLELGSLSNTKGFWSKYSGCVGDAITAIAKEPIVALACMYWGPYCAGGIAFMCLGATR